ncbi:MAG: 16S rRNA (guanine(527)-N(7))-methyltransferase RsmG [Cyanobacteria bacterium P01_D01_bin.105]
MPNETAFDFNVSQPAFSAKELPKYALPKNLELWQQTIGWQPSTTQQGLFQKLYDHIVVGNNRLNLTRITTPEDFWEKHLWDALSGLAPWLVDRGLADKDSQPEESQQLPDNSPLHIIDIGTGGGIPGIPAAIALTPLANIHLTLLDSTRKKVQFLKEICPQLNLHANCVAERAETLAHQPEHREAYDLALIRAVGPAATCAEYAIPFLKVGAQAVLFRGQWSTHDTDALMPIVELLGGEITDLKSWKTPLTGSDRHCIFIHKEAPTPSDFPRAIGIPAKKPLR